MLGDTTVSRGCDTFRCDQTAQALPTTTSTTQPSADDARADAEEDFLDSMKAYETARNEIGLTRLRSLEIAYTLCNETDEGISESVTKKIEGDTPLFSSADFSTLMWVSELIRINTQFWQNMRSEAIIAGICDV